MTTILSLLLALNAQACDCVPRELPELFREATVIATVKARSAKENTFEVEAIQVWKGDKKKKEFSLKTSGSTCGYQLVAGEKYLVFASGPGLNIDGCSGTKPLADAGKDILWMKMRGLKK